LTVTNGSSSVGGGTLAISGGNTITLTNATIAAGGSLTFSVTVTGVTAGSYTDTTSNVSSSNGGTGSTASASLTVLAPPSIAIAFSPTTIAVNGTTNLTFTITNPNAGAALTGVGFTDALPTGLTVASDTFGVGGGTVTISGNTITLTGATITTPAIFISVSVTGASAGSYTDTTGNVSSSNGGTGNSASATLNVLANPTISAAFSPTSIQLNGTTSLTFTISNPNAGTTLSGIGFTDTLPAGLTAVNGSSAVGGGTLTVSGGNTITLTGASLTAFGTLTGNVSVTGTSAGSYTDTTGNVSSSNGGTGNSASATINVLAPPSIAAAFSPTAIVLKGTNTLTFTITNPNSGTTLSGVGFTDTLPSGLMVGTGPSSVGGGTVTLSGNTVTLNGAEIAAGGTLGFSVTVMAASVGNYTDTTGNVTSSNGGTGNTASATLTAPIYYVQSDDKGNVDIINTATGALIRSFQPFSIPTPYTGRMSLAVGDVNGDGIPDLIVATRGSRAGKIKVYDGATLMGSDGVTASNTLFQTKPVAGYQQGLTLAAANVTGGKNSSGATVDNILVGVRSAKLVTGGTVPAEVVVFNGASASARFSTISTFDVFTPGYTGGVYVAAGSTVAGGLASIAVSSSNKSDVQVWSLPKPAAPTLTSEFTPFGSEAFSPSIGDGQIAAVMTSTGVVDFVTAHLSGAVSVIADSATGIAVGTFKIGSGVTSFAISSINKVGSGADNLGVALPGGTSLAVVDPLSGTPGTPIAVTLPLVGSFTIAGS
jgi:uncharacterized repeat protein (TIGR01451 family)